MKVTKAFVGGWRWVVMNSLWFLKLPTGDEYK